MSRTPSRRFTVLDNQLVTPHMRRVTLGGEGMQTFPADQASAYIKLMLPAPGHDKPVLRTYTVRAQRPESMDVDFAIHGHGGPASRWAETASPGDTIDIGGPGATKRVDASADWFLLAGDMTALPAISANLESLPDNAQGQVVVEVVDPDDVQTLEAPAGIDIDWVINPHPGQNSDVLPDALKRVAWQDGRVSAWVACEFSAMRKIRSYLKTECGIPREQLYISSYWKHGSAEEAHKQEKRADAEKAA